MDSIHMSGLQFYGFHGALREENRLGQRFVVHMTLYLDLHEAGQTDTLSTTVDYAAVYASIKEIVEGSSVKLIERLANKIAETVLTKFSRIDAVEVEVEKPGAPIQGVFGSVSARIHRQRAEFQ